MFEDIKASNANWVALVPQVTLDRYTLTFVDDSENDYWSETVEGVVEATKLAKQAGLKVFWKPHIVLGDYKDKALLKKRIVSQSDSPLVDKTRKAGWRGSLSPRKEQDWQKLEQEYESHILKLANIATTLRSGFICGRYRVKSIR